VSEVEPILLHELLSGSLRSLEKSLSPRGVKLVRQIDRTTPPIFAERQAIQDVVDSLLAEAVNATVDHGRIRVCLKHNGSAVMLSIKDQGRGYAEGTEALFDDPSRSLILGAALNLAGCRQALRDNGGNVFANTAQGKGSTFYVTFKAPHDF
jgi:signal transduction histidine kinase